MNEVTLITTLAGILVPLSEILGGRLFKLNGFAAQALTWAVGVLLGVGAGIVGLASSPAYGAVLGFLAALTANGVFSMEQVKQLLEVLRLRESSKALDKAAPENPVKTVADILREKS